MDRHDDTGCLRLDAALVVRGLTTSRERAKASIQAGEVLVNGRVVRKASAMIAPDDDLRCEGEVPRYVGRGGLKLEKALAAGGYDLRGARAMDIGASTGGFTDCMLQHGADTVYAVDVGHGQLHTRLLQDERVKNCEGCDIRDTERLGQIIEPHSITFCSVDVSFISLKKILPFLSVFLSPPADVVCLIKPQFEAGRALIGKNGVVKDSKTHKLVIDNLCAFFASQGYELRQLEFSPITGGEGNIEYLALLRYGGSGAAPTPPGGDSSTVVAEAHNVLRR